MNYYSQTYIVASSICALPLLLHQTQFPNRGVASESPRIDSLFTWNNVALALCNKVDSTVQYKYWGFGGGLIENCLEEYGCIHLSFGLLGLCNTWLARLECSGSVWWKCTRSLQWNNLCIQELLCRSWGPCPADSPQLKNLTMICIRASNLSLTKYQISWVQ